MSFKIQKGSLSGEILMYIFATGEILSSEFFNPYQFSKALRQGRLPKTKSLASAIYRLQKSGLIEFIEKGDERIYKLTKTGTMEALFAKAKLPKELSWDGKWRLMVFDIPEKARQYRSKLRQLLRKNNFKKFQASVYISPYALNMEAILYLQESGLSKYIRILRIDQADNEVELKKMFNLK